MSKVTLEFDPTTEQDELYVAQNGWKYKAVLDDLFNWLRRLEKSDKNPVDIFEVRKYIADSMNERSIEL